MQQLIGAEGGGRKRSEAGSIVILVRGRTRCASVITQSLHMMKAYAVSAVRARARACVPVDATY